MESQEVHAAQIIKSDYKKSKIRLEWIVTRDLLESVTVDKNIVSPNFKVTIDGSTYNWVVAVYPKGKKDKYESYVCLFVRIQRDTFSSTWKDSTIVEFDASVKSEDGSLQMLNSLKHPISKWEEGGQGFGQFCDQDLFEDLYVQDNMTFVIDAIISVEKIDRVQNQDVAESCIKYEKEASKIKLMKTFGEMYKLTSFSDIVIFCGDQKFLCHKLVLASRSPVLKEMLENELEGKIEGDLEITDASPVTFKVIIDHIYSGEILEDGKLGTEVFQQAVKYNLEDLAKACEINLFSNLTEANSLSTLKIIDEHRKSSTIRKDVIKFIAMNVLNIMDTADWESFAKDCPRMMTEIMRCLATKTTEEVLPTIQCKGSV